MSLKDAHTSVAAYDLRGKKLRDVELPGLGTAFGFGGAPGDKETFFVFTGTTTPTSVYRHDLASGASTVAALNRRCTRDAGAVHRDVRSMRATARTLASRCWPDGCSHRRHENYPFALSRARVREGTGR